MNERDGLSSRWIMIEEFSSIEWAIKFLNDEKNGIYEIISVTTGHKPGHILATFTMSRKVKEDMDRQPKKRQLSAYAMAQAQKKEKQRLEQRKN